MSIERSLYGNKGHADKSSPLKVASGFGHHLSSDDVIYYSN